MTMLRSNDKGGSFRELRERHLPLFDETVHRHDRGWPHEPTEVQTDRPDARGQRAKRGQQIFGIFHFPTHPDER